jgi:hypothetical protein
VVLDASGAFADNRELNYLSGRVGTPHAAIGGVGRADALQRVKNTVGRLSVAVGTPTASAPPAIAALRPYPWTRFAPQRLSPDGADLLAADPIQERVYRLPRQHVSRSAGDGGRLVAGTGQGRSLLDQLVAAGLGVVADERTPNVILEREGVSRCT